MKAVSGLFGGGTMKSQKEAMAKQEAMLAEERRKVEAVDAGQMRARNAGRGLLAFIDQAEMDTKLGGGTGAGLYGQPTGA